VTAAPAAAAALPATPFVVGYGTNGLADHRLPEALDLVAGLGYGGVGLTLDHHHLDPAGDVDDLRRRAAAVGDELRARGLVAVVETGGRYVLDPWRKHWPVLVGPDGTDSEPGREARVDLLRRAVLAAAALGAPVVSFWSGTLPAGSTPEEGTDRLLRSLAELVPVAEDAGVRLALEPEPDHHVAVLDDALAVLDALGRPAGLGLTLDVGHAVANEPRSPGATVRRAHALAPGALANVQLDDMRPGVHEHLPFGEGEVDLPDVLAALVEVGYTGLAAVELPRHGHAAPVVARRSRDALAAALATALATTATPREPADPVEATP
jgi:sugar phosphate isomerase/epimerase